MSFLLGIELNRVKERKICAISLYRDGRNGDGGRRDLPRNVLTVLYVSLGCGLSAVQHVIQQCCQLGVFSRQQSSSLPFTQSPPHHSFNDVTFFISH